MTPEIETQIKQHFGLTALPPLHLLTGGLSGVELYWFEVEGRKYVSRLFPGHISLTDRRHRIEVSVSAGNSGLGPKVHLTFREYSGTLTDFISGEHVAKPDLPKLATFIRQLHSTTNGFPKAWNPFQKFYTALAKGALAHTIYPETMQLAFDIMYTIESILNLYPHANVPTHLDIHSQNLLMENGSLMLLDWDVGGLGDPFADLANICLFYQFSAPERTAFFAAYLQRTPTDLEHHRLELLLPHGALLRGALFLPREESLDANVCPLSQLLDAHDQGAVTLNRVELGLSFLHGGLSVANQPPFQEALIYFQRN